MSAAVSYNPNSQHIPDPAELYLKLKRLKIEVARRDPNGFCEYVLRDNATGRPVIQAPFHTQLQQMFTQYPRLVCMSHVESGKTNQAIGRALFELGKDHNLRIAIVSSTAAQSKKIAIGVRRYIDKSAELKEVFPSLAQDEPWGQTAFTIKRSGGAIGTDPSVQIATVGSGAITGARLDLVILDDVVTMPNSKTPEERQKIIDWYVENIVGRLTDRSRVWALCNAVHPEDLMHALKKNSSWQFFDFPIISRVTGESNWPAVWPMDRIMRRKKELDEMMLGEFDRQMMCVARDDTSGRFKDEWIQRCLERGRGIDFGWPLGNMIAGARVLTGVDVGGMAQSIRRRRLSDETILFTVIVMPNGDRRVWDIRAGRWFGPDLVRQVLDVQQKFGSIVYIESNGAQKFLVDFAQQHSGMIKMFNTGANKWSPEWGIESLMTEMSNGKWIIPSLDTGARAIPANAEIEKWVREMRNYNPTAHTGDRLMASWIAREGAYERKRGKIQSGPSPVGRFNGQLGR